MLNFLIYRFEQELLSGDNIMNSKKRLQIVTGLLIAVCLFVTGVGNGQNGQEILKATGVRGGLIVHIGCGNGRLTAALRDNERYIVHALDTDANNVEKAREYIQSLGLYGAVSVGKWNGGLLPYADNLINLVISENLDGVSMEEVMRVLRPLGVAYIKLNGKWTKTVKPWPKEIDEWTHWLHSPDGNAVARDSVVGPPRHIQWAAEPLWARHHNTVPSTSAMVSARGRLFYISDEALPGLDGSLPDKWFLVARDAFNGVLLWKRPIPEWGWRQWNTEWEGRFNMPPQLPKRLVAAGERLYATLNFNAPLAELDAATGELLKVYEGTDNTDEILYKDGLLILSVNEEARKPQKNNNVPVKKSVCVFDAGSGKELWRRGVYSGLSAKYDSSEPFGRLELVTGGDKVFFVDHDAIISLDLKSGREEWRVPRPKFEEQLRMYNIRMSDQCVLVYQDGVVLFAQPEMDKMRSWHTLPGTLYAYNAKDGKFLWKHQYGGWAHNWQPDVFVIDGLVWVHEHIPIETTRHEPDSKDGIDYAVIGLDLKTGVLKRRFSTVKTNKVDHHHRCYRGKATELYLLPSRRGVEFLNLETEENLLHHWARGGCLHGIVPCNGLLYLNPHPCRCYIETKLNGYYALAPKSSRESLLERKDTNSGRFEKGPAYGKVKTQQSEDYNKDDWPTFRHDPLRSGSTTASISRDLEPSWQVPVGSRISPPVVAGGKVFVCSIDEHLITAIDAASGKKIWSFVAGGRVDTPPTIYKGLVLFGSMDGWVYCLREADGQLVWRRLVAPCERLVGAYGQIESAWPVHGSILVKDGVAYLAAGRSSYLDGGIFLFALDPVKGDVIEKRTLYSPDPETDEMLLPTVNRKVISGALSDILVSDGSAVFMRQEKVFGDDSDTAGHILSTAGFRDDAWFNRAEWIIGTISQTQLVVFDDQKACGIAAYGNGNSFQTGDNGYKLFAGRWKSQLPRKPAAGSDAKSSKKKKFEPLWTARIPVRFTAMVLVGQRLFAAGPPDIVDPKDPLAALEGRKGAELWIVSTENGKKLIEYHLESPPVFDGMAIADGRLYISLKNGKIICFEEK